MGSLLKELAWYSSYEYICAWMLFGCYSAEFFRWDCSPSYLLNNRILTRLPNEKCHNNGVIVHCRISGLFRVKSAHKIKLTDRQLLQWMFPVLFIMVIYLGAWSAGSPAAPEILYYQNTVKYPQCAYGWWDHCLVLGKHFPKGKTSRTTALFLARGLRNFRGRHTQALRMSHHSIFAKSWCVT